MRGQQIKWWIARGKKTIFEREEVSLNSSKEVADLERDREKPESSLILCSGNEWELQGLVRMYPHGDDEHKA